MHLSYLPIQRLDPSAATHAFADGFEGVAFAGLVADSLRPRGGGSPTTTGARGARWVVTWAGLGLIHAGARGWAMG